MQPRQNGIASLRPPGFTIKIEQAADSATALSMQQYIVSKQHSNSDAATDVALSHICTATRVRSAVPWSEPAATIYYLRHCCNLKLTRDI